MDLIDDLETDLAMAILVERRHHERFDRSQAKLLIGRVRNELFRVLGDRVTEISTRETKERAIEC